MGKNKMNETDKGVGKKIKSRNNKNIRKYMIIAVIAMVVGSAVYFSYEYTRFFFLPKVTTRQLDKLQLDGYKKLMIVAHPDDELIWGGAHLLTDDYLVVCITRGYDKTRKEEFEQVMQKTEDVALMLYYPDKIGNKRSDWKWWKKDIEKDLETIINYKEWDVVVTHNQNGEYGHQHHIMTHDIVDLACEQTATGAQQMYFGKYYKKKELEEIETKAEQEQKPESTVAEVSTKNTESENAVTDSDMEQIDESLLQKKIELAQTYASQKKVMKKLYHMFPYENWEVSDK